MIDFERYKLDNGLTVILHEEPNTPMTVVNTLYKVGSRDEHPGRTGFAHLFEHLMFSGSRNVPDFDRALQAVGGDNNAFTNTDLTNYYITLPSENLETALWVESDRMRHLNILEKNLAIQKKVVVEEFKQRYLNQPYGDAWLLLRPLAYTVHPYRWATIGMTPEHIEHASLQEVREFYDAFYQPGNAVLVVAGNIGKETAIKEVEKWFGDIEGAGIPEKQFPVEPAPESARSRTVEADVPQDAIYKVYPMPGRRSETYYAADLVSDLLGRGKSSVLYRKLVREKAVFSSINASVTGSFDPGLLVIAGRVGEQYTLEEAHETLRRQVHDFCETPAVDEEIDKAKNQMESTLVFSETELLNRAMGLAVGEALGNANLVNEELEIIHSLTTDDIEASKRSLIRDEYCSTLLYRAKK